MKRTSPGSTTMSNARVAEIRISIEIGILTIDLAECAIPVVDALPLRRWDHPVALAPGDLSQKDITCVAVQRRNRARGAEPEKALPWPGARVQVLRKRGEVI